MALGFSTSKITWQGVVVGVVIGIIFAPQIMKLPGVNRLPTA
jgi:hypothetical protein